MQLERDPSLYQYARQGEVYEVIFDLAILSLWFKFVNIDPSLSEEFHVRAKREVDSNVFKNNAICGVISSLVTTKKFDCGVFLMYIYM